MITVTLEQAKSLKEAREFFKDCIVAFAALDDEGKQIWLGFETKAEYLEYAKTQPVVKTKKLKTAEEKK